MNLKDSTYLSNIREKLKRALVWITTWWGYEFKIYMYFVKKQSSIDEVLVFYRRANRLESFDMSL